MDHQGSVADSPPTAFSSIFIFLRPPSAVWQQSLPAAQLITAHPKRGSVSTTCILLRLIFSRCRPTQLYTHIVSSRLKKALSKLPRVERGTWYRLLASYTVEENPRERPTAEKLFQGLWPHACVQRPPSPRAPCLQFASLLRILGPLFLLTSALLALSASQAAP